MGGCVPSHVGICVSDMERAIRFYCDGLGFERAERYDLSSEGMAGLDRTLEVDGPVKLASQMVVSGFMKVELLHFDSPPANGRPSASRGLLGLTHLSFHVDGVDEAAARLVAHGGTVLERTRSDVGIVLLFVADPDGTRIELMGR